MIRPLASAFLVAAAASCLFTLLASRIAWRLCILAPPNPRVKTHTRPTPLLGGAAILGAFLPVLVLVVTRDPRWKMLGLGLGVLTLLGLYKDKVQVLVSPLLQLAIQTLAVCSLLWGGMRLQMTRSTPVDVAASWVVGLWIINAWNFLDVMDGLAGGVATLTALFFAGMALRVGDWGLGVLAIGLAGATMGFLIYNLPPARVFMGDVGSFGLGLIFSAFALLGARDCRSTLSCGLLLFLPLFEVLFTSASRILRGRSPLKGDASHASLQLLAAGWTNWMVIALAYLVTTALGLMGLLLL